ncbi:MAG: hypothetical protein LBG17_07025 [Bacteroidales bacterium]|jgi:hypothetical protein|nr:hypothetical protein [Bacteroidales bacterium]
MKRTCKSKQLSKTSKLGCECGFHVKQEHFLPEEIIKDVKMSASDDNFSGKVMHSLQYEEKTPLWHYVIYFFAFVFTCILCSIFGGKLSFDIITNAIIEFFSSLTLLLKDVRFYAISAFIFLIFIIIFIKQQHLSS